MLTRNALMFVSIMVISQVAYATGDRPSARTLHQRQALSLSLAALEPLPPDPSNRWADDPRAAAFGERLFFEKRLSSNGQVACASCHDPKRGFQDDRDLARGTGTTLRRTMPIAGTAYSPFLFWDGRKDSQWAQALGPLESAIEHGGSRTQYAHVIATFHRAEYEGIFGALPDFDDVPSSGGPVEDARTRSAWDAMSQQQRDTVTEVFVNVGKALAAYERQIRFKPSRFDRFLAIWQRTGSRPTDVLNRQERAGLALFLGKAQCVQCHNGPLLTNNEFHNTGVPSRIDLPEDRGRFVAIEAVQSDEFNCRSRWSDARATQCQELEFLAPASAPIERAFKVPSLRNVAERAPYMHAGQFANLRSVLDHYNSAPPAPRGRSELKPLRLSRKELDQLEAFLHTLSEEATNDQPFVSEAQ